MLRLWVLLLGLALLLGALTVAGAQVMWLEQNELEHVSPWASLRELQSTPGSSRISARMTEVKLEAGESTFFELCAKSALEEAAWSEVQAVVWQPKTQKLELKVALDPAHLAMAKRAAGRSCLPLGGGEVASAGTYAVDLAWGGRPPGADILDVPLRARVLARRPLGVREGLLVLCAALGALLSVLAAFAPRESDGPPQAPPDTQHAERSTALFAVLGTALAVGLAALVLKLPLVGSLGGLARGVGLSMVEVAVAYGFARLLYRSPRKGLSLHAPSERPGLWLLVAAACAALLPPLARWAMSVVPATGEAPIEAFISWPSGALAFAALGMAVPLAEELFFRGFVFGALRPLGPSLAFAGTLVLFTLAHAPQAWGNWGALLSVTLTGAVLTGLRAATGSTLVPAVAHLLYNLSLWKDSFRG